jgi:hypothetical protein
VTPFDGDSIGCGNFSIYQLSEDGTKYLQINMDVSKLDLSESQEYFVGDSLEIKWREFNADVRQAICNDVAYKKSKPEVEKLANSGIINLMIVLMILR